MLAEMYIFCYAFSATLNLCWEVLEWQQWNILACISFWISNFCWYLPKLCVLFSQHSISEKFPLYCETQVTSSWIIWIIIHSPCWKWRSTAIEILPRLNVGLHINIYEAAVSLNCTLLFEKAYLVPWEQSVEPFSLCYVCCSLVLTVMWSRLNVTVSLILHGLGGDMRTAYSQMTLTQHQQAFVWTPHVRVNIGGQVLHHQLDLRSVRISLTLRVLMIFLCYKSNFWSFVTEKRLKEKFL